MAMLPQLIPPFRYAIVEEFVFRGSYPTLKNYRFLRRLHLKTIVSLTPEPYPNRDMRNFCEHEGITNRHFYVDKFQDEVTLSTAKVLQILQIMIRPENLPLYLHCLDGTHVTGLVVMCFRKLQSWNLSTSASEYCSFQKSGEISREESQFVEAFRGDIEIPYVIPKWLWQGIRTIKHPTFRLRLLPAPVNTEQNEEDLARNIRGNRLADTKNSYSSPANITSGHEDLSTDNLGRHRGSSGLVSLMNTGGHLSRLTISGQSDMTEGAVIYGASEERGRFRGQRRRRVPGVSSPAAVEGDEGALVRGGIVYRSPTYRSTDRNGTRRAEAVARFSHDGWGLQYTERKRTLEALALEGLRVVGSGSGRPAKLPVLPRRPPPVLSSHLLEGGPLSWLSIGPEQQLNVEANQGASEAIYLNSSMEKGLKFT